MTDVRVADSVSMILKIRRYLIPNRLAGFSAKTIGSSHSEQAN